MKLHGQCFVVYHVDNETAFLYIKSGNACAYSVYFKSKKEHNYDRFVDPNILGAARLVHLRIYLISFFLLDRITLYRESTELTALFLSDLSAAFNHDLLLGRLTELFGFEDVVLHWV